VPAVGAAIVQGNSNNQGLFINLQAIAIGNGWVDPYTQYGAYGTYAYAHNLIDQGTYSQMNQTYAQCQQYISQQDWDDADDTCNTLLETVLEEAGNINVYNIDLQCNPPPLCYDLSNITNYLNEPSVQQQLGVASQGITWEACSDDVNSQFGVDRLQSFSFDVPLILKAGVRVVVYSGDLDLICNWMGGYEWVTAMSWSGQTAFVNAPQVTWHVSGNSAGMAQTAQGLTFVRVYQAGHMVPHDQPANALALLANVLNNTPFK